MFEERPPKEIIRFEVDGSENARLSSFPRAPHKLDFKKHVRMTFRPHLPTTHRIKAPLMAWNFPDEMGRVGHAPHPFDRK